MLDDLLLQGQGRVVERRRPKLIKELSHQALEGDRAGVLGGVDPVAKAHDLALGGALLGKPGLDVALATDGLEGLEDALIRAAMQGAVEGPHRRTADRVRTSLCGGDDSRRKGRRVHGVLSMEHQAAVEGPLCNGRGLLPVEHPKEVRRRVHVRIRGEVVLATAQALEGGHQGWGRCEDAHHGLPRGVRIPVVHPGARHAKGSQADLQGVHRVTALGQGAHELDHLIGQTALGLKGGPQAIQLGLGWQVAVKQKPAGLLEVALLGKRLDAVTAVLEDAGGTVNKTDGGLGGGNASEPGD